VFSLPSSRKTRGVGTNLKVLIFIFDSYRMKTIETTVSWVDFQGYPVKVGEDRTAHDHGRRLHQIQYGEVVGDISELIFLRPGSYIMTLNIAIHDFSRFFLHSSSIFKQSNPEANGPPSHS